MTEAKMELSTLESLKIIAKELDPKRLYWLLDAVDFIYVNPHKSFLAKACLLLMDETQRYREDQLLADYQIMIAKMLTKITNHKSLKKIIPDEDLWILKESAKRFNWLPDILKHYTSDNDK